jgi:sialic acid synthase SpsE
MESFHSLTRPFVIAEIGGNHEGNFQYAVKLLHDAVEAGADAVKFQTYTPDRIVSKVESPERHKHFGRFALSIEQYIDLANLCRECGVQFMSSIWDRESIDVLDPYVQVHKVGSGDLTNYPLLKNYLDSLVNAK